MNDDLRFDPVDDELRRRFDGGAPTAKDADVVLDELRPRLQQARIRRRAAFSGALVAAAMVVVVLVVAFSRGGGTGSVHTPPASGGDTRPDGAIITTVPQPTVTTLDDHGSDGSGADDTGETPAGGNETSGSGAVSPPVVDSPATTPSVPPAAPDQVPYSSDGGSIVVNFDGSQVSLASSSSASGFTAEVHDNGPTRVEVRFSNGQIEWRIRVDVVNGALVPEITQH